MATAMVRLMWAAMLVGLPVLAAPPQSALSIDHAVIRVAYPGARTGAAYLQVRNTGTVADRLEAASFTVAARSDLHGTTMAGGMMQMRALAGIDVPAGGSISLAPGGMHVMLVGIKAPLIMGSSVPGTLRFAKAGLVKLLFTVQPVMANTGQPQ